MNSPCVSLSIVSHGQGALVSTLLEDLRDLSDVCFEIIITVNIPEDLGYLSKFKDLPIRVLSNTFRKGFGENHNAAFLVSRGKYFAIINPDIRASGLQFVPLIETLEQANVGACAPEVRSITGEKDDSVRRFPNVWRLIKRVLLNNRCPDYTWDDKPISVDWVAGMFILFSRKTFSEINGFDERYFMYMEDVDICKRLHEKSLSVILDPRVSVVHDAQRASRYNKEHIIWHLQSLFRYLWK